MKTRLFTKSAIIMATAFSLASCSQEEELVNPNTNPNTNTKTGRTVFSAGGDNGTRTTMDKNRVYYWQTGDQIWVNDGGTWVKSSESQLAPDSKTANFYFDRVMTADSYDVLYTGIRSNDPTKVTIPASASYNTNVGSGIGYNGDCGVATATRNANGTYSFALLHKPGFLGIAPIQANYLRLRYSWKKIEITDVNGKPIAGTFAFSKDGMDANNVTSPSSTVTLNAVSSTGDPNPRIRLQNYNENFSYIYEVIPPSNRQLMVKYTIVEETNPSEEIVITKRLNARNYIENNVVQFTHILKTDYYSWDAPISAPYDKLNQNPSEAADNSQAINVCATMPNYNELTWYVLRGDPHWDETTEWTDDGGASYHTGGVWIKKKQYITGFSSTEPVETTRYSDDSDNYRYAGKPEDTSKYFFLPALGHQTSTVDILDRGVIGMYWSSSAGTTVTSGSEVMPRAYRLFFDSNSIGVGEYRRAHGLIAGHGSRWFK